MAREKKPQNRATFVKGILRRASFHWKARDEALKRSRVDRGKYKCEMCEGIFPRQDVELDHIYPVIDPQKGFTTFDEYIERLFCDIDGFQVICEPCHDAKTLIEDQLREAFKTPKETLPNLKKSTKKKKKDEENA
jgi:hypothetical protein